jgi:hypothetical protein
MKSVKELLEAKTEKAINHTSPKTSVTKSPNVPSVIILRRKAIRQFPDNQKIVLYYSDALDKYVSVPFGPDGEAQGISLSEEEQINEWIFPAALAAARAVATSSAGRAAITGAAELGKRGLAYAGKLLNKYRGTAGNVANKAARKARKYGGVAAGAVGYAAVNALTGGEGSLVGNSHKISDFGATKYRETQYKVSPNSQTIGTGPQIRRNWDEVQKAQTKRIWNSGSYSPQGQVYESIKEISKSGKTGKISIGENSIEITPRIAKRICECHAMLNTKNQKNFEAMLSESVPSLKKIIDFSIRKGK